jgi:DNA-directed RNA polymerase subunit H (RpoH/RPB5)
MSVGSITVDLLARTGSFETDMARAAKTAQKRAKEIDEAVSKAGERIGVGLSAAGIAAVYFGKQLIDGLDALNDYSDATGASIENLSALQNVAERTGTDMDNVSGILVKFNNVLKEVDGKNSASQVLKKLGLDAEELKRIDPAEALRQTAVALAGFADDGNKARYVQELFGKSIKEAAPFLKDLAEQTQLVGTVTGQQAQAAEDFNKQLFALKNSAAEAGRSLISDLLPAMTSFLKNAREIASVGGFGTIVKDAAKDVFGLGKMTGDNGADIKQFMRERLQKDLEFSTRRGLGTRSIESDLAEINKLLEVTRLKQRNEVARLYSGDNEDAILRKNSPALKSLGDVPKPLKDAKAPKESELQKYIEQLSKQLDKTKELTVAEMVLADVSSGRLKLQKGETIDGAVALAKQVDAAKALVEYRKLSNEAEEARAQALLKSTLEQEAQAKSMTEGNKSLREEIELIGKSVEAQAAIEKARITSAIAIKQQELSRLEGTDALVRETDAIRQQIVALEERRDLVGAKAVADRLKQDADEAKQFATQVGAAFESSFEKAIIEGDKLSDVLAGLGKDLLQLYIRNNVTGPLAKSLFGGGSGGGGGLDFGSIASSIGKWFGGLLGFADGGDPPVGKASLVGERGPELFVPRSAGTIIPNHALGGGPAVNLTINNTVGNIASLDDLQRSQRGTERRIAAMIARSQSYGGQLAP